MTTIYSPPTSLQRLDADGVFDEAQRAAAAFLARYSGRTLDAYRHDLRGFFQWSADVGLTVLAATRPHIELYRGWMEDRGLAASTIDRRLSTVCSYYRFAHIDGRIPSNPAQYLGRGFFARPWSAAASKLHARYKTDGRQCEDELTRRGKGSPMSKDGRTTALPASFRYAAALVSDACFLVPYARTVAGNPARRR